MLTLYNVYVGQLRDLKVKLSGEMIVLNVKVVLILQRFHELVCVTDNKCVRKLHHHILSIK